VLRGKDNFLYTFSLRVGGGNPHTLGKYEGRTASRWNDLRNCQEGQMKCGRVRIIYNY